MEPNSGNIENQNPTSCELNTESTLDRDDEHFCIKCKRIITGLNAYISHRGTKCDNSEGAVIILVFYYVL